MRARRWIGDWSGGHGDLGVIAVGMDSFWCVLRASIVFEILTQIDNFAGAIQGYLTITPLIESIIQVDMSGSKLYSFEIFT